MCFPQPSCDGCHSHFWPQPRKVGNWHFRIRVFGCPISRVLCEKCGLYLYPMLYKTLSAAVYGIDANIIQVEVDCSGIKTDQDHFHTVGLPDAAVRESRDRVRAALKNCGYDIPPTQ